MKKLELYNEAIFEDIKRIDESGNEYWEARELMFILEYSKWQKFINVIANAKITCENSEISYTDHFVINNKMVEIGSGAKRKQV